MPVSKKEKRKMRQQELNRVEAHDFGLPFEEPVEGEKLADAL